MLPSRKELNSCRMAKTLFMILATARPTLTSLQDVAKLVYDRQQILALDPCRRFALGLSYHWKSHNATVVPQPCNVTEDQTFRLHKGTLSFTSSLFASNR